MQKTSLPSFIFINTNPRHFSLQFSLIFSSLLQTAKQKMKNENTNKLYDHINGFIRTAIWQCFWEFLLMRTLHSALHAMHCTLDNGLNTIKRKAKFATKLPAVDFDSLFISISGFFLFSRNKNLRRIENTASRNKNFLKKFFNLYLLLVQTLFNVLKGPHNS